MIGLFDRESNVLVCLFVPVIKSSKGSYWAKTVTGTIFLGRFHPSLTKALLNKS